MEQKFDGVVPKAELKLEGRKVTRSVVSNDWGLQLRWAVARDGKVIATAPARAELVYEHPDTTPGTYEIVLQTWKYVDYKKGLRKGLPEDGLVFVDVTATEHLAAEAFTVCKPRTYLDHLGKVPDTKLCVRQCNQA